MIVCTYIKYTLCINWSTDVERKHYLNAAYAAAKKASPTRAVVVRTTKTDVGDVTLKPTELQIRTVYGGTRDLPFHDVSKFAEFKL